MTSLSISVSLRRVSTIPPRCIESFFVKHPGRIVPVVTEHDLAQGVDVVRLAPRQDQPILPPKNGCATVWAIALRLSQAFATKPRSGISRILKRRKTVQ